jgi:hypothetical protein
MTLYEELKASLAYEDFSSDWKQIVEGHKDNVEAARNFLRDAQRNVRTCEFILRQEEEMLDDSIKRAQESMLRSQRDPRWCYTCDRPKNDCGCVENGGTY